MRSSKLLAWPVRVQTARHSGCAVLFLVLIASPLMLVVSSETSARIKAPFEVARPATLALPQGLTCTQARSEAHAYAAYERVRKALSKGKRPTAVPYLGCFLPAFARSDDTGAALETLLSSVFDADVLYGYLARRFEANLRSALRAGRQRQGSFVWKGGNLGRTALIAYERTGERRFFDLYRDYFDRARLITDEELGWKDDHHRRVMKSWGASNLKGTAAVPDPWVSHVTHFAVMMVPATAFAREAIERPKLADARPWAAEVIAFFEAGLQEFEGDLRDLPKGSGQWYRRPFDQRFEPTNHIHLLGEALIHVAAVTGNPHHKRRVQWILDVFARGVRIDKHGLASWNYSPWFERRSVRKRYHVSAMPAEQTRKGAITVPFVYAAIDAGYRLDRRVANAVTASIRDWILKNDRYKLHVHRKRSRAVKPRDREDARGISASTSIAGFHVAAAVDPSIARTIVRIVSTRHALYPRGWFEHPGLARSYARMLR